MSKEEELVCPFMSSQVYYYGGLRSCLREKCALWAQVYKNEPITEVTYTPPMKQEYRRVVIGGHCGLIRPQRNVEDE